MTRVVFLTGATGNLGAAILGQLLVDPDVERVFALIRARSGDEARARVTEALRDAVGDLPGPLAEGKLNPLCGDITVPGLGLDAEARAALLSCATHVVHAAAYTRFTLPLAQARLHNTLGTRHVADLAGALHEHRLLQRFLHISTAYVCGTAEGEIPERLGAPAAFSNSYEQSKHEAERLLAEEYGHLPCTVVRPSIVVGDSRSGRIRSCEGLYRPLRWILEGTLGGELCQTETPLDVVPVDYVASAVMHLLFRAGGQLPSPIHLAAGRERCMTVRSLVDSARAYARHQGFILRRSRRTGRQHGSTSYAPYVTLLREFRTDHSERLLAGAGITPRPLQACLPTLLNHVYQAHWARRDQRPLLTEVEVTSCAA
jgi:long-chain acyl-CoA synthetase